MIPPDWLVGDVTALPVGDVTGGGGGLPSTA